MPDVLALPAGEPDVAPTSYPKPGEDSPKRRGRPPGSGAGGYRATKLKAPIEAGYRRAGQMALKYDPPLAVLLAEHADACATAWDELAKTNKTVNRLLTWLVELKNKGGVAGSHSMFFLYAADRFHVLERFPFIGDLLVTYIESHVNELLQKAMEEGILQPLDPEEMAAAAAAAAAARAAATSAAGRMANGAVVGQVVDGVVVDAPA